MTTVDWMPEARAIAAQCWCDPATSNLVMDSALAEAVARRIAGWMETAAEAQRNRDFYRDILDDCAKYLGVEAFTDDSGEVHTSPIRLKIPELVAEAALAQSRA